MKNKKYFHIAFKKHKTSEHKDNEHRIQKQIVMFLRLKNILVFETDVMDGLKLTRTEEERFSYIKHHENMGYVVGQSDLVIVLNDVVIFLEVKDLKKYQTPNQKLFEKKVKGLGHQYYVVRSLEDVMGILEKNKSLLTNSKVSND